MDNTTYIELPVAYENSHPVEGYMAYDWHAWPVLRFLSGFEIWEQYLREMSPDSPSDPEKLAKTGLFSKASTAMRFGLAFLRLLGLGRRRESYPGVEKADIAIVTLGDRVQSSGDFFYHSVVDPLVEMLSQKGKACTVWELGDDPKLPRRVPHAFIRNARFNEERLVQAFLVRRQPLKQPEWFEEYSSWLEEHVGETVSWDTLRRYLMGVEVWSRVFEKWLRRSGCSALIVDCWYDQHTMGATLAASRLGLWSMDIQHGLQGAEHYAYSSWTKTPEGGYEVMPDGFWMWGRNDAENLVEFNKGVISKENVLVGGNLWLNMWRAGEDQSMAKDIEKARTLCEGYDKAILVTPSFLDDHEKSEMFRIIKSSPRDWFWMIRAHRSFQSVARMNVFEEEFRSLGRPGINLREATSLPLYALFKACDCHMTRFSTCAIEALAFGVPSIILHPHGAEIFKQYIDAGVMCYCADHDKIMECVELCEAVSAEACLRQANSAFASPEESRAAIDDLIARMDAARNQTIASR